MNPLLNPNGDKPSRLTKARLAELWREYDRQTEKLYPGAGRGNTTTPRAGRRRRHRKD